MSKRVRIDTDGDFVVISVIVRFTDDEKLQVCCDVHPILDEIMQASELTILEASVKPVLQAVSSALVRDLGDKFGCFFDAGRWAGALPGKQEVH